MYNTYLLAMSSISFHDTPVVAAAATSHVKKRGKKAAVAGDKAPVKRKYTKNLPPSRTLQDLTPFQQKLISPYIPFIPQSHHHMLFDLSPSIDNPAHIHAVIFSVWTLSHTLHENKLDVPEHFLSVPFHSFLFHISNTC
jgi:hypothetical protein